MTDQPREMTEQDAFLSSMIADPDNVTARLAYADYLEDHDKDGSIMREDGYFRLQPYSPVIYWVPDKDRVKRTVSLGEWHDAPKCGSDRGTGKPCDRPIEYWAAGQWRCRACAVRNGLKIQGTLFYPMVTDFNDAPATPTESPAAEDEVSEPQGDRPTSTESAS